ncbi:MAG: PAS domain-containing protein [Casimicrobiaceae bacterium]
MSDMRVFFTHRGRDIADFADGCSDAELDQLPLGLVLLDANAKILRYNKTEGALTGRDPKAVIGRNFFLDLAACGVGPLFWGRFKQGILKSDYDEVFPYVFWHEMPETAMLVRMTLARKAKQRAMWVMVRRIMPTLPSRG